MDTLGRLKGHIKLKGKSNQAPPPPPPPRRKKDPPVAEYKNETGDNLVHLLCRDIDYTLLREYCISQQEALKRTSTYVHKVIAEIVQALSTTEFISNVDTFKQILHILIQHGANLSIVNSYNETCLECLHGVYSMQFVSADLNNSDTINELLVSFIQKASALLENGFQLSKCSAKPVHLSVELLRFPTYYGSRDFCTPIPKCVNELYHLVIKNMRMNFENAYKCISVITDPYIHVEYLKLLLSLVSNGPVYAKEGIKETILFDDDPYINPILDTLFLLTPKDVSTQAGMVPFLKRIILEKHVDMSKGDNADKKNTVLHLYLQSIGVSVLLIKAIFTFFPVSLINAVDINGRSPVFYITHPSVMEIFKENKYTDFDIRDQSGLIPVLYMIQLIKDILDGVLLENVSDYDLDDSASLILQAVGSLLSTGRCRTLVSATGYMGMNVLMYLVPSSPKSTGVGWQMITIINDLLANNSGFNINFTDDKGRHLLFYFVKGATAEQFQDLLTNPKIFKNKTDKDGNTVLHYAIMSKREELVQLLIDDKDVDVNLANSKGETALFFAVRLISDKMVVKLCYRPNINLHIRNIYNKTAIECAETMQQNERTLNITKILKRRLGSEQLPTTNIDPKMTPETIIKTFNTLKIQIAKCGAFSEDHKKQMMTHLVPLDNIITSKSMEETQKNSNVYQDMSKQHREILLLNREQILAIMKPAPVVEYLHRQSIMSDEFVGDLNSLGLKERSAALLDMLPILGEGAWIGFIDALRLSKQTQVVAVLQDHGNPFKKSVSQQVISKPSVPNIVRSASEPSAPIYDDASTQEDYNEIEQEVIYEIL